MCAFQIYEIKLIFFPSWKKNKSNKAKIILFILFNDKI